MTDHEHFHLVCRECGRVESKDRTVAGPLLERLELEDGFRVDLGHLTIFGTCRDCVAGSSPSGHGATPPT